MKELQQKPTSAPATTRNDKQSEAPNRKDGLKSVDFQTGEAMLKPEAPVQKKGDGKTAPQAGGNDKSKGTTTTKGSAPADKGPSLDGPIADQVPDDIDLKAVRMSFTIPGKKTLDSNWQYTAQTTYATNIGFEVTPTGLSIWTSPGLYFDATWPAQNMNMYGAGINFANGKPYADFRLVRGMGEGFLDYTEKGEKAVTDMLSKAIAGTAMAKPGYNPLKDKDLMATLMKVKSNFDALPTVGGGDKIGAEEVSQPTIGATLGMKSPFVKAGGGAGISIPGGGVFDVSIAGSGNLASILKAGSKPQAAAMAAGLESIVVTSDAMTLIRDNGKPLAKLQQMTIRKGGGVSLDRFELLGGLGAGAGVESLIRLFAIIGSAKGGGVGGAMRAEQALQNGGADPVIVKGVSKSMIETGISEAVRALFIQNRNAVPGMDLALVFGIK
jgi:hypothetical protein